MKELDFRPYKSKNDFRQNYKLHDLAEQAGKNLLTQWGIKFQAFGEDKRYEKLWEKGEDKPDQVLLINSDKFLLDWKGKHKPQWILNKRAYDSYIKWSSKLSADVLVVFFVFSENNNLTNRKFGIIGKHKLKSTTEKQWDRNETVEFKDDLPDFNKANLLSLLDK